MILIAGNNIRHIVASARRSGYRVCACDSYLDSDLFIYADRVEPIKRFEFLVKEFDEIVLGSGLETADVPQEKVLGTPPKKIRNLIDKKRQWKKLNALGFDQPELVDELEENEVGVLKPRVGSGGVKNQIVKGHVEFDRKKELLQKYIEGVACSVCVISNGKKAVAITANRQLLGIKWAGQSNPLAYCGNITPFPSKEIERIAEEVVESFELIGCNGVDFVISDKPYVIEVNPRFQGSLDSVELSADVNLFQLHVQACEGKIPEKPKIRRYAGKIILFSKTRCQTKTDLTGNPFLADIPQKGRKIEPGSPLLSVIRAGSDEKNVMEKLKTTSEWVYCHFREIT